MIIEHWQNVLGAVYMHHHHHRHRLCQIYIVWMMTNHLTKRIDSEPNLSIKRSVSIGTMLNFDRGDDGHGDGGGTCKQAFRQTYADRSHSMPIATCSQFVPLEHFQIPSQ